MLARSDPFIFLGPGCPTLYYPKHSDGGTGQPLPSFIVQRRSVQPLAFILPSPGSQQSSHQADSVTAIARTTADNARDGGRSRKKKSRGKYLKRKAVVGGRKGKQSSVTNQILPTRRSQSILMKSTSSQTEWVLDTRENFVFVEANQIISEAVVGTSVGWGGAGDEDDHNSNLGFMETAKELPFGEYVGRGEIYERFVCDGAQNCVLNDDTIEEFPEDPKEFANSRKVVAVNEDVDVPNEGIILDNVHLDDEVNNNIILGDDNLNYSDRELIFVTDEDAILTCICDRKINSVS